VQTDVVEAIDRRMKPVCFGIYRALFMISICWGDRDERGFRPNGYLAEIVISYIGRWPEQ